MLQEHHLGAGATGHGLSNRQIALELGLETSDTQAMTEPLRHGLAAKTPAVPLSTRMSTASTPACPPARLPACPPARLPAWGYGHKTVCHARGEYARDEDGGGFCEVHVNTMEGFWSLLRSWLRPHCGISQDKLPLYLGFFRFMYNARRRGKALLDALIAGLVA